MGLIDFFKTMGGAIPFIGDRPQPPLTPNKLLTTLPRDSSIVVACVTTIIDGAAEAQAICDDEDLLRMLEDANYLRRLLENYEYEGVGYMVAQTMNGLGRKDNIFFPDPKRVSVRRNSARQVTGYAIGSVQYPPEAVLVVSKREDLTNPLRSVQGYLDTAGELPRYMGRTLANNGLPPFAMSPKMRIARSREQVELENRQMEVILGHANAGKPLLLSEPTDIIPMGHAPRFMALVEGLDACETEISAVLGVPPIIAGLGVGLRHSTYANYSTARLAFHQDTIVPKLEMMAKSLGDFFGVEFSYDFSGVAAFAETNLQTNRAVVETYQSGLLTLAEARGFLSYELEDENPAELAKPLPQDEDEPEDAEDASEDEDGDIEEKAAGFREIVPVDPPFERALRRFYRAFARRVVRRLRELQLKQSPDAPPPFRQYFDLLLMDGNIERVTREEYRALLREQYERIMKPHTARAAELADRRAELPSFSRNIQRALDRGETIQAVGTFLQNGTFTTVDMRANLTARNESFFAQNHKKLLDLSLKGVTRVRAKDNQTGFNDPECTSRDGEIMSIEEAAFALAEEHQNGTLEFVPVENNRPLTLGAN